MEQAASPPVAVDLFLAVANNRLTVFYRWRQSARPYNTQFFGLTPFTIPNGSLIGSAVFARQMPHSPYTTLCLSISAKKFPLP